MGIAHTCVKPWSLLASSPPREKQLKGRNNVCQKLMLAGSYDVTGACPVQNTEQSAEDRRQVRRLWQLVTDPDSCVALPDCLSCRRSQAWGWTGKQCPRRF